MTRILRTEKRIKREAKYLVMYNEYCELVKEPKSDKMAIIGYLTKKHKISQSCIYNYLRKRKNE
ncbi:MAG: hypothetical protein IIV72_08115 [Alistipes sp.]|nr:hypothetical protein [Alistipes sp.]